ARQLTKELPQSNTGVGVTIVGLPEQVVGDVRVPLLIMLGVVAFLLLMVCANIGNLLLARASAREREFAVRAALGASRVRLLRQMLAESVLLSAISGVAGLALAYLGVEALRALAPSTLPRIDDIKVNGVVAAFRVALPPGRYATEPQRTGFYAALSERLQATAGVTSASAISFLPLSLRGRTTAVSAEGDAPAELPGQARFVDFRSVAPGYFRTMSIPIRAGRDVAWSDTPASRPAIVVSET